MEGKSIDMSMNDIAIYARLMAEGFIDDPGVKMQLEGVSNKLGFLEAHCRCQIEAFLKIDGLTTVGNGDGILPHGTCVNL